MCEPTTIALGIGAAATAYSANSARKSAKESLAAQREAQGDPAAERAKAEAEAAQRANAQLADSNRRRREQQSLMSKGGQAAPQFTLGDSSLATDPGTNTLSAGGATTRNTVARQASLMSRGDVGAVPTATGGITWYRPGGGGSSGIRYPMAAL